MNAREMILLVGKHGLLRVDEMQFPVVIRDVKCSYGTDRYEVAPVNGRGTQWVNADRVKVGE